MADVEDRLNQITRKALEEADPTKAAAEKASGSAMGDLLVRFVSAVAMAGAAVIALWLGSWFWVGFVVLLAGLVLWEWNGIVSKFGGSALSEIAWQFVGAIYVGAAALAMVQVRFNYETLAVIMVFIAPVVAVDVGAYFAGRLIGGPRILPSVSPSKTWAGLLGGIVAATLICILAEIYDIGPGAQNAGFGLVGFVGALVTGTLIAVIAQAGDFFQSWMKRRADVKDSGNLMPGHGGIFDRLDGFIAVFFVLFLMAVIPTYLGSQ